MSSVDLLVDRLRADPPSDAARAELAELAAGADASTRRSLIAVLARPGTTDAARLAVLGAIEGTLIESDIEEIARVSVRQRANVLGPTLELFGNFPTAESLFALAKVFAMRDDHFGERAAALARDLRSDVAEAVALDAGAESLSNGDAQVSLAYAAAASDPAVLAGLRGGEMTPLKLQLEEELALLDERIQDRTKAAGGSANEFDARLRDELYEVMALTALPVDERLQARALENLFRRTDLGDVAALAAALPGDVLRQYVARSLTRANRRGARTDRAVFALQLAGGDGGDLWQESRPAVIECLDEDASEVRIAAALALAQHAADLEPELRRRIAGAFGALDSATQERLADSFAAILATDADAVDLAAFLTVVGTSTDEDLRSRLGQLLERLDPESSGPDEARQIVSAYVGARAKLEPEACTALDHQAVQAASSWIRARGRRAVEAVQAAVPSVAAAEVVTDALGEAIERLRADQARVLASHLIEQAGLAKVISAVVPSEQFERVVLPAAAASVTSDPQAVAAAFEEVNPVGQRRLLVAALSSLSAARRHIAELSKSSDDEDIAALQGQLAQVLGAIDAAERAAAGNDDLLRHFVAIRQALSGLSEEDGSDTVPQPVREWRLEAARRLPQIVQAADDGCRPLRLEGDLAAHTEAVLDLLIEVDQRANSPRVVSADARPHHALDLRSCVASVADAGLLDGPRPLEIPLARATLGQAAWSAWAARHADAVEERLRAVLATAQDPASERRLVLQVDALALVASDHAILRATRELEEQQLPTAWRRVSPLLVSRIKELEGLQRQARERSTTAMERVADGLAPSLRAIESVMASYFRLRRLLADAGWRPVEETLGRSRSSDDLDHQDHQVVGSIEAEEYLVRTLGIRVRGHVADKAIVEALIEREEEA